MIDLEDIQSRVEGSLNDIEDAAAKASVLIEDLKSDYAFLPPTSLPCHDNIREYRRLAAAGEWSHNQPIIANFEKWICHYEKVMIKIEMINDYLKEITKAIPGEDDPIHTMDWQRGKSIEATYEEAAQRAATV